MIEGFIWWYRGKRGERRNGGATGTGTRTRPATTRTIRNELCRRAHNWNDDPSTPRSCVALSCLVLGDCTTGKKP